MNINSIKSIFLALTLLTATSAYAGYLKSVEEIDGRSSPARFSQSTFTKAWTPQLKGFKGAGSYLAQSSNSDLGISKFKFKDSGLLFQHSRAWDIKLDFPLRKMSQFDKFKRMNITEMSALLQAYFGRDHYKPRPDDRVSVPEPSSLALLALGLVGLGLCRRKNRLS